jgi:hypothetical protein
MSRLPTAEEANFNYRYRIGKRYTGSLTIDQEIEMMAEFAKLCVQDALKEASEKAKILEESGYGTYETQDGTASSKEEKDCIKNNSYGHGDCTFQVITVSKQSILNAYPLTNIK